MRKVLCIIFCLTSIRNHAQIPVEVFAGTEKLTLDLMFFTYFKNSKNEQSPFLFFNRNRLSIDYRMTSSEYQPQFGATEAISYNKPSWAGFAPVAVLQATNAGVYPKSGVQYARITSAITLFSWAVCEWKQDPYIDLFVLFRYTPAISEKLNLFVQAELFNAFPTSASKNFRWTQRVRLGLQRNKFQFGAGTDLSGIARIENSFTSNTGLFTRYVF